MRVPDPQLAASLHREGFSYAELARLAESGQLIRVRRGAYAHQAATDPVEVHRQLVGGTLPQLLGDAVVSHVSAAALHRLPVWPEDLERVHVVRARTGGGRRGRFVHVHPAPLQGDDVVDLEGVPVTSLARTVADCGRTLRVERAVAIGDAALRQGLSRADVLAVLARGAARHGDPRARRMLGFLDAAAESPGESVSRVRLSEEGLPPPELQLEVADAAGQLIARSDFGWRAARTLGEFDGKIKYGRLLRPDQSAGDVIYQEKLREDRLRDLGWEVVRWGWDDLSRPELIAERLRRAFVRGSRRAT